MNRSTFFSLLPALLLVGSFSACKNNKKQQVKTNANSIALIESESPVFDDENITMITQTYIAIKNGLVRSDANLVSIEAKKLAAVLVGDGLTQVEKEIVALAKEITLAEQLNVQRKLFSSLTERVYQLSKEAKITEGKLYYQYCPMAEKGKGAYWLSSFEQIQNPYFGSSMLNCGVVNETL